MYISASISLYKIKIGEDKERKMFSACHVVHLLCLCVCMCLLLKVMLSKVIDICSMIFFKIVKCHL